jgi:hypothetical protein
MAKKRARLKLTLNDMKEQMLVDAGSTNEAEIDAPRAARLRSMRRCVLRAGRRQHDAAFGDTVDDLRRVAVARRLQSARTCIVAIYARRAVHGQPSNETQHTTHARTSEMPFFTAEPYEVGTAVAEPAESFCADALLFLSRFLPPTTTKSANGSTTKK